MFGWRGGRFFPNSADGGSRERLDMAAPDGGQTKAQLAAELGVPESELAGFRYVVGRRALREVAQLCGYSRRSAQKIVTTLLNGTILVSPHGLFYARLDALTETLLARRRWRRGS